MESYWKTPRIIASTIIISLEITITGPIMILSQWEIILPPGQFFLTVVQVDVTGIDVRFVRKGLREILMYLFQQIR
jgi:hypothetical protein